MKIYFLWLVVLFASTSILVAQAPGKVEHKQIIEMSVDMPDETQGTDLLDKGDWQLEAAYLHNIFKTGGHSAIEQAILRYGVSKYLEVRLLVETGRQLNRYIEETVQSTYPAALSTKVLILKDHGYLPDITLISFLHLPVYQTSKAKKAYWSPIFIMAFENALGKKWKLDYNAGIQQEAYSTEWAWIGNASLHYKMMDQLEIFCEYFAQYQAGDGPQHNLGVGAAFQLNNFIEVFAMAGSTVNYAQANHYYNGGLAFRLPKR